MQQPVGLPQDLISEKEEVMNLKRSSFLALKSLALASLLMCILALGASARPSRIYQGTFTLDYEVRWAGTVLEPGAYSPFLDSASSNRLIIRHERGAEKVLPWAISRRTPIDRSVLVLREDGGKRTVEAIHLAEPGLVFHYGPEGKQTGARQGERIERIPISPVPQGACPEYCLG